MPAEDEFTLNVKLQGVDELTEKISAAIQKALAMVKTPGMKVAQEVGTAKGTTNKNGFLAKHGDMINRMASVGSGLGAGSASSAVAGAAGGEGLMAAGGPMMTALGAIVGLLEQLAPIQAVMTVIMSIMKLVLLPMAMELMAILMPFLLPLLQIMSKLPWAKFFSFMMTVSADISKVLNAFWNDTVTYFQQVWQGLQIIWSALTAVWNAITTGLTDIGNFIIALTSALATGIEDLISGFNDAVAGVVTVINTVGGYLQTIWNWFNGTLGPPVFALSNAAVATYNWFASWLGPVISEVQTAVGGAWSVLSTIYDWFSSTMGPVFQAIGEGISVVVNVLNAIAGALGSLNPGSWHMPALATGGLITKTGMALVHAGETVVPAKTTKAQGNSSPNITVNVTGNTIASSLDLKQLASKISASIENTARRQRTW